MERLLSIGQLEWFRNKLRSQAEKKKTVVLVCMTGCRAYGSADVKNELEKEVKIQGLKDLVEIRATGCHGLCAKAPVIAIEPLGIQYQELNPDDAVEVTAATLKNNQLIDRLAYKDPRTGKPIFYRSQIPFYMKQERRVLSNCGKIDPTKIDHYIAAGGYQALVKALSRMTSDEVIEEVSASKIERSRRSRLSHRDEMEACPPG